MSPEDLKEAEKLFCENIRIGYTPEYFVIGMSSGSFSETYSLTPKHAKRLLQYLGHEVKEYDAKHEVIEAVWNPNIVSPVQRVNPPTELS